MQFSCWLLLGWLKVFVYLTDVSSSNGPHVYIPGTHIPGSKPSKLLKHGYARINDKAMAKYHDPSTWVGLTLPKGSVIFADTRCWHKGQFVQSGSRGILSMTYAPSLFSKKVLP